MLDYIASKAPNDAFNLMRRFDPSLPRPNSPQEMSQLLQQFVQQEGSDGMRLLMDIHPDRDMFEQGNYANADGYGDRDRNRDRDRDRNQDGYSCACGCGLGRMTALAPNPYNNFYGANGNGGGSNTGEAIQQSLTLLVGGALVMIVVTHALKALS